MRAQAPLGRLVGLAMICAGLGTATLATPEVAAAATADSPTAIAVARNGTTYVGFATGGKLVRLSAGGRLQRGVPLDQDEAVDGLFVTDHGDIWVDYETGVSLLSPGGGVKTHFDHRPSRGCDHRAPATRYGGITANGDRVYVANRCHASVSVYARNGHLVSTVDLPGNSYPRGIAYGNAQAGRPAFLYVAVPDRGQVLAYKASTLRGSSRPAKVYTLRRPGGGRKPQPAGIAVDKWGQLTVSDMANNALYMLDTNHDFSLYRTLGHPPRASRAAGRLNGPSALAQHVQDGGSLAGNLFIADTDNNRVQRWNTNGYTFWSKGVRPGSGGGGGSNGGGDGGWNGGGDDGGGDNGGGDNGGGDGGGGDDGGDEGGPTNQTPPSITGTAAVGGRLTCHEGDWGGGGPGSGLVYAYSWRRNGATILSATGPTYTVLVGDDGADMTCVVRATNAYGSSSAVSDPVRVSGTADPGDDDPGGPGPINIFAPSISGTPAVGQVLTCNPGTWSGADPGFTYQWRRGSVVVGGAATYAVGAADSGQSLTCTVTASSSAGSRAVTSQPVTVGSVGGAPVNTALPEIGGSPSPGDVVTCNPGTWSGTVTSYGYQWRLGGVPIPRATWPTYTVLFTDLVGALSCSVTARNSLSSVTATSAAKPVTPWSGHAPSNSVPPSLSGTAAVGQTLTCNVGTWNGIPELAYATKWQRDGADVAGATGTTYAVPAGDAGHELACVVTVANGFGMSALATGAVTVTGSGGPGGGPGGGTPAVPAATAPPEITGNAQIGSALTCAPGTWTGSPTSYRYSWSRDGTPIPQTAASKYLVLSEDVSATLTCTVTAVNSVGTAAATSAGKEVPGPSGHAPENTDRPAITGTAAVGQTLSCDPGTWTGTPDITYLHLWQRDGDTIANGPTHTVVSADSGKQLRCVVIASNGSGKGAARSAPVGGDSCGGAVGVTIEGGALETTTPSVQLSIRPPAGATSVTISNDSGFATSTTVPLVSTCSYAWTMSSIPGLPMSWSVHVRFDTGPTAYSDSIVVREPAARLRLW